MREIEGREQTLEELYLSFSLEKVRYRYQGKVEKAIMRVLAERPSFPHDLQETLERDRLARFARRPGPKRPLPGSLGPALCSVQRALKALVARGLILEMWLIGRNWYGHPLSRHFYYPAWWDPFAVWEELEAANTAAQARAYLRQELCLAAEEKLRTPSMSL